MRRARAALAALALTAAVAGGVPAPAAAAARSGTAELVRGISDGGLFANRESALRDGAGRVANRARAQVARFPIAWSTVVRERRFVHPPEDPIPLSDPAHPTYVWARIDAAVRDATARGLEPMAYFMTAPKWAESAPRYRFASLGTWAPRPRDLGAFASAVARRYDGRYPDPERPGQSLPQITRFQSWNEPNLGRFLQPIWVPRRGRPELFAAGWYRRMHRAVESAIHARQPGARVALAGVAPTGTARDGEGRVAPMRFLRAMLCLGQERPRYCGPRLRVDAIAVHPLSIGDPDRPAEFADDLAVADVEPKLARLLRDARAAGQLSGPRAPERWVTELNWASAGSGGVPARLQAAVVGRAIRRLWQAGATLVNWQFASDPVRSRTGGQRRPAGLTERARSTPQGQPGRPKPFLAGFALPTVALPIRGVSGGGSPSGDVRRGAGAEAYVWALAGPRASHATFEVRRRGRWQAVRRVPVRRGAAEARLELAAGLRVRVRAAGRTGPAITIQRMSGFVPSWAPARRAVADRAVRALVEPASPPDLRPADPRGPGRFAPLPPRLEHGVPPPLRGMHAQLVKRERRVTGPQLFCDPRQGAVVLGTRAGDRFRGPALFFGLGGRDHVDGDGRLVR